MLSMSVSTETKRTLCSEQFHLRYGEGFSLTFNDDGEPLTIRFVQKIEAPKPSLLPFSKANSALPHINVADNKENADLCYELVNFNQTKITTNPIPFYAKQPSGHYYFQITAMSISSEVDNPDTIWLYTATIYEDDK